MYSNRPPNVSSAAQTDMRGSQIEVLLSRATRAEGLNENLTQRLNIVSQKADKIEKDYRAQEDAKSALEREIKALVDSKTKLSWKLDHANLQLNAKQHQLSKAYKRCDYLHWGWTRDYIRYLEEYEMHNELLKSINASGTPDPNRNTRFLLLQHMHHSSNIKREDLHLALTIEAMFPSKIRQEGLRLAPTMGIMLPSNISRNIKREDLRLALTIGTMFPGNFSRYIKREDLRLAQTIKSMFPSNISRNIKREDLRLAQTIKTMFPSNIRREDLGLAQTMGTMYRSNIKRENLRVALTIGGIFPSKTKRENLHLVQTIKAMLPR